MQTGRDVLALFFASFVLAIRIEEQRVSSSEFIYLFIFALC